MKITAYTKPEEIIEKTKRIVNILSTKDNTCEIINKLNSLEVFKSNEDWLKDNVSKIECNNLANQELSENLSNMIKTFDNNINPFMNKSLLISDFRKINEIMDIELDSDSNIIKLNIPSIGVKLFIQRNAEHNKDFNYSLTFRMQFKDELNNDIDIMHTQFYWGNAFWIKDGENRYFIGSRLYKKGKEAEILEKYLEMANIILEEDFLPLIAYDFEDYKKRNLKK